MKPGPGDGSHPARALESAPGSAFWLVSWPVSWLGAALALSIGLPGQLVAGEATAAEIAAEIAAETSAEMSSVQAGPARAWTADPAEYRSTLLADDPAGGGDATISPDGRYFVTTSMRGGQMDVWLFDIEARTWMQVTDSASEDFEARFSPAGDRLVFTSTRSGTKDIWILPLYVPALAERDGTPLEQLGQGPRRLTTSAKEDEYPVFSPDGEHVVYTGGAWGARDFWTVPAAGGTPEVIGEPGALGGRIGACSFDPASLGSSLVCHDYGSGTGNLLRLWLDGETAPLTRGGAWDYKPTTSGDGRWLAFSRALEGPSHIWLMPSSGGRARRLTSTPDSDRWPTWSDDGRRLFFHRLVDRGNAIELLDRRTGQTRRISRPGEIVGQAALHPSGEELAYCVLDPEPRATHRIRRVRLDSEALATADRGGPLPSSTLPSSTLPSSTLPSSTLPSSTLRVDAAEACWPRYFPDGRRLALAARSAPGARWDVGIVDLPSGASSPPAAVRLVTEGRRDLRGMDGPVDVAPDGRSLVFHADTLAFEANLYLADLESGEIEALTDDAWFDEAPAFTADGGGVVFMSTRGGDWTWGLYRLDLGDRSLGLFAGPDWVQKNYVRPAGTGARLWAQATETGTEQIVEQARPGLEPSVVVAASVDEAGRSIGARWPAASRDGRYLAYTRVERRVEYWLVENPTGVGSPIRQPEHTPRVRLAAYVPSSSAARSGEGGAGDGGAGDGAPTLDEAAPAPTSERNVHSAPTPPGGIGGALVPAEGSQASGSQASESQASESQASGSQASSTLERSPVDPFHR